MLVSVWLIIITVTMDFHAWGSFCQTVFFIFSPCPIILSVYMSLLLLCFGVSCTLLWLLTPSVSSFFYEAFCFLVIFMHVYCCMWWWHAILNCVTGQKQCARCDRCRVKSQMHYKPPKIPRINISWGQAAFVSFTFPRGTSVFHCLCLFPMTVCWHER